MIGLEIYLHTQLPFLPNAHMNTHARLSAEQALTLGLVESTTENLGILDHLR